MMRENGRRFQTVTYINSTAAVKALSDWIVTSGNAEETIRRVPADQEILFVPDRHLGEYLQEVTGRKMILWNGACMVHEIFSVRDLLDLKKKLPAGITIAHPEHQQRDHHADQRGGSEEQVHPAQQKHVLVPVGDLNERQRPARELGGHAPHQLLVGVMRRGKVKWRSEEHTSELQSLTNLV